MIAEPARSDDLHIRADGVQLLPEKADINLDMVLDGVRIEAPALLEDGLLRQILFLLLHQHTHHIKLLRTQAEGLLFT